MNNKKQQQQKQNKSSKIIDCFAHLFLVPAIPIIKKLIIVYYISIYPQILMYSISRTSKNESRLGKKKNWAVAAKK